MLRWRVVRLRFQSMLKVHRYCYFLLARLDIRICGVGDYWACAICEVVVIYCEGPAPACWRARGAFAVCARAIRVDCYFRSLLNAGVRGLSSARSKELKCEMRVSSEHVG